MGCDNKQENLLSRTDLRQIILNRYYRQELSHKPTFYSSYEEWLPYLQVVSTRLGLRHEKELLDGRLVNFLAKKRKSDNIQDQLAILEVFEPIMPHIYEIYKEKLKDRSNDEFDIENVAEGISTADGLFYQNSFLPCCIFLMYQEWLKVNDLQEGNIFRDLFTLGSGSATRDLTPEVHGFCLECAPTLGGKVASMDLSEIRNLNMNIFKKQKEDKFKNHAIRRIELEDESTMSNISCNPFDDSEDKHQVQYNPFDSSSDDSCYLDSCEYCYTSFPSEDFVRLHMKIFHAAKAVTPVFVGEGEELMQSFIHEQVENDVKSSSKPGPKKERKHRSSKYGLRSRPKK